METPYLGVGGTISKDRWALTAEGIGSLWARAHDRDDHVLRTTLFEDTFSNMKMVGANASLSFQFTELLALVGRAEYQKYFETKGPTTATDYSTGVVTHTPGEAAGMYHYSMLFSLGLRAKFP